MKINGIAYLIIGGFVTGYSFLIAYLNDMDLSRFALFLIFGAIFICIGVFRLITSNMKMHSPARAHAHPASHSEPHGHARNVNVKYCSNCGSALRHFDQFCYRCGNRAFHRL